MIKSLLFIITSVYKGIELLFPNSKAHDIIMSLDKQTVPLFKKIASSSVEDAKPIFRIMYPAMGFSMLILYSLIIKIYGDSHVWIKSGELQVVLLLTFLILFGCIQNSKFANALTHEKRRLVKLLKIELLVITAIVLIWVYIQMAFSSRTLSYSISNQQTLFLISCLAAFPIATIIASLIITSFFYVAKKIGEAIIWLSIQTAKLCLDKKPNKPLSIYFYLSVFFIGVVWLIIVLIP